MKKRRWHLVIASLAVLVVLSLVSLTGCAQKETATQLAAVEIREYEGQQLTSVNSYRENSIAGVQEIDLETYRLKITGLVEMPQSLTYTEATEYPRYRKVVEMDCVEGWSNTLLWEGILVKDLIADASALPEANTVIFHAEDGYTTSLPLSYIIDNNIILAFRVNEVDLPAGRGFPFQLVAESKWGYKWIRWITEIELSNDENYRGYWESRGYSNTADLDEDFFD